MSLFDKKDENTQTSHTNENFQGFHPIDETKKLMQEVSSIVRDIRKMVDKAQRAMKIMAGD